jgi:hypothetical protein
MPMFRTILLLDGARRAAALDLTEHLRRCAAESGIVQGLMTIHSLDPGFRFAVEEPAPVAAAAGRTSGVAVPFLSLPEAPLPALRDALLLDLRGGELRLPGAMWLVNLDAADRPGSVLVRIGAPSETSGPAPGAWERVFTRVSLEQ